MLAIFCALANQPSKADERFAVPSYAQDMIQRLFVITDNLIMSVAFVFMKRDCMISKQHRYALISRLQAWCVFELERFQDKPGHRVTLKCHFAVGCCIFVN